MTEKIIITLLVLALIYLYYQNRKLKGLPTAPATVFNYDSDSEDEVTFPSRQKLQFELQQKQQQIEGLQGQIERLKTGRETSEDYAELETERDEAIREKNEAEAEVLSLSNKLKLKNQEVSRKEQAIQRLVKEKGDKEIALNKTITELKKDREQREKGYAATNSVFLSKQKELEELEKKYSKQGQQLDGEQVENNKLSEKVTQLEQQIQELSNRSNSPMPGEFPTEQNQPLQTLKEQEQTQFRELYSIFDLRGRGLKEISFEQLKDLLVKEKKKNKK